MSAPQSLLTGVSAPTTLPISAAAAAAAAATMQPPSAHQQLVQAAVTAQHVASAKLAEQNQAAQEYQVAAIQAATTADPVAQVQAATIAHHAAAKYQAAAGEVATANRTVQQLQTVLLQTQAPPTALPIPVTAPLAAGIAAGLPIMHSGLAPVAPGLLPASIALQASAPVPMGGALSTLTPVTEMSSSRETSAVPSSVATIPTTGVPTSFRDSPGSNTPATGTPTSIAGGGSGQQYMASGRVSPSLKVLCSSGGYFTRGSNSQGSSSVSSAYEYEGGETRLLSIPNTPRLSSLMSALDKITGPNSSSSEAPRDLQPVVKYRLPSDPTVWVDLIDDEDVQMMLDEWEESLSLSTSRTARLHLYVQWRPAEAYTGDFLSGGSVDEQGRDCMGKRDAEVHVFSPFDNEEKDGDEAAASGAAAEKSGALTVSPTLKAPEHKVPSAPEVGKQFDSGQFGEQNMRTVIERLEIINVEDISLLKFLGSGGFGDVHLGKWCNVEVAVKCLNPSLFFQGNDVNHINRAAVTDLIKEADMLGGFRHPNIVWVYGIVLPELDEDGGPHKRATKHKDGDIVEAIARGAASAPASMLPGALRPPAIVTEYMAGGSLKGALARKADIVAGALTRLVLALDAAKGLEYLHSKHVVHFDLKPANMLLGYRDKRPVCKIADFGLAREKRATYISGVSSQRGTLPWTAPEILKRPEKVCERCDVYSFAICLWELWTGQEPYQNVNYHALMHQLTSPGSIVRPPIPGTPEWESSEPSPPELAPGYRDLMERCWAEDPDDRPSFTEVIKSIRTMIIALKPQRTKPVAK